jgi:orotate phosphoribosyltransferase
MQFRSYSDLIGRLRDWQTDLPRDFTVVCGVPRSGLLVANLLALQWNLPLTDPEHLLAGRLLSAGRRLSGIKPEQLLSTPQKILVVDDSVHGGATMLRLRASLDALHPLHELKFASVYATQDGSSHVDFVAETLSVPRVFEWNLFHHSILAETCMDIDGVLCRDPLEEENDDGPRYREFLSTATPRHIPSGKVGWLVTSRLEKYRPETVEWLRRHGVQYDHLLMLDLPDKETRLTTKGGPSFKAAQLFRTKARLFIESDVRQAQFIAEHGRNYVICTDTMQLFGPGVIASKTLQMQTMISRGIPDQYNVWLNRLTRSAGHLKRGSLSRVLLSRLKSITSSHP